MSSLPSDPATEAVTRRRPSLAIRSPFFALAVLFSMNLLNYVDRYVFFSAGPRITKELDFDDAEFGAQRVVHGRLHPGLADRGLAGRSIQP